MIRFPELPSMDLSNSAARQRRRRGVVRMGMARDGGAGAGEMPSLPLAVRRRLADDSLAGVELVTPRFGHGGLVAAALHHLATLGEPWDETTLSVVVGASAACDALLIQAADLISAGLEVERLEIVLSEAALLAVEQDGVLALAALRDLGIGLSVDGFGVGVTSLSLLRRLPLTGVKLARSLVRGIPESHEDAAMARAVVTMAQAAELSVVADGIESERQRAFFAHCGCDVGQGPLFGPAVPLPVLPAGGVLV